MGASKGQASAEYLSNYTIAAVVIVIVLAVLFHFGVLDWILPSQVPICIFQKGIDCDSQYIQYGNDAVKLKLSNTFDDAIVIYGVICSGEAINPATALPYNRNWNNPAPAGNYPTVTYNGVFTIPPGQPAIPPRESFDLQTYCYTENGAGASSLTRQDRFKGIVFIQYRLNSSPPMFMHVIQGNLQGTPN